jgi:hypothetical protein
VVPFNPDPLASRFVLSDTLNFCQTVQRTFARPDGVLSSILIVSLNSSIKLPIKRQPLLWSSGACSRTVAVDEGTEDSGIPSHSKQPGSGNPRNNSLGHFMDDVRRGWLDSRTPDIVRSLRQEDQKLSVSSISIDE